MATKGRQRRKVVVVMKRGNKTGDRVNGNTGKRGETEGKTALAMTGSKAIEG